MKVAKTYLWCVLFVAGGCISADTTSSRQPSEEIDAPTVSRHIAMLNPGAGSGRRFGTAAYSTATGYVTSQYRAIGLHPGLGSSFEVPFIVDRNLPLEVQLRIEGRDSLDLIAGIDYAADGRTGTNEAVLTQFISGAPTRPAEDVHTAIVIDSREASDAAIKKIHRLRYPAAILVGPLSIASADMHADSMIVLQVTRRAFGRYLGVSPTGVTSVLQGARGRTFTFPVELQVQTEARFEKGSRVSNIVAVIPGKSPGARSELIVVASTLEGGGTLGGLDTFRYGDLGIGSAAIIALSRRMQSKLRYSSAPRRSLMFVHFAGSSGAHSGVRAFFENPLWSRDAIVRMLLVGMMTDDADRIENIASRYGIIVERFDIEAPDDFAGSGYLANPRRLDLPVFTQREGMVVLGRREVRAAKDSAAVAAGRNVTRTETRLMQLVPIDSTFQRFPAAGLERNSNEKK